MITQDEIIEMMEGMLESDAVMGSLSDKQVDEAIDLIERIIAEGIAPHDGYVLVPIKPTNEMCKAGFMAIPEHVSIECDNHSDLYRAQYRPVWKAMLASAPKDEL